MNTRKEAAPWELGSDFHWGAIGFGGRDESPWDLGESRLLSSGRDALRFLLESVGVRRGWKRIWLPTYLCEEVRNAALSSQLQVVIYRDEPRVGQSPRLEARKFEDGDCLYLVNQYGMRRRTSLQAIRGSGVDVIEDHTHDPWSDWARESEASYCFASLRKTLPLPDGAVVWSPLSMELPPVPPVSPEHEIVASRKLWAMLLKERYLQGELKGKGAFRSLFVEAEEALGQGVISGASPVTRELLPSLSVNRFRAQRKANGQHFAELFSGTEGAEVISPKAVPQGQVLFGGLVLFSSSSKRDLVRQKVIQQGVYPAVLWPLSDEIGLLDDSYEKVFAARSLFFHVDGRYDRNDMERLTGVLRGVLSDIDCEGVGKLSE
jgi:hypothetical protein